MPSPLPEAPVPIVAAVPTVFSLTVTEPVTSHTWMPSLAIVPPAWVAMLLPSISTPVSAERTRMPSPAERSSSSSAPLPPTSSTVLSRMRTRPSVPAEMPPAFETNRPVYETTMPSPAVPTAPVRLTLLSVISTAGPPAAPPMPSTA